jgi:hypothetical protein
MINSLLSKLHCKHNKNETMITLLNVLRGFSACYNWRWNVLQKTSKSYCAPLTVTVLHCMLLCSPACYCAPLGASVLTCQLLWSPASYITPLPVTVLPCLLVALSHYIFSLSLSRNYLLFRAECFLSTFQHCECNRLCLYSFDVSTSYTSFRWGAAGEKCDVTV